MSPWMRTESARRVSHHMVEYDPFVKSQLASRNQLQGLLWCKFGHVAADLRKKEIPVIHRVAAQKVEGWPRLGGKGAGEGGELGGRVKQQERGSKW